MADYIPDIQHEILKWLPVRSLLRFRCVCKWWKQLIDSPSFLQDHLALQQSRLILECVAPEFFILDPRTLPLFDALPGPIQDRRFHLAGTLHGIVCLYYDPYRSIYLWNPSIRKFSIVPLPEFLGFNWKGIPGEEGDGGPGTYSAFFIDPSSKNFKILLFKLVFDGDCPEVGSIYSSIEGCWKEISLGEVLRVMPFYECPAIVIGGMAYWLSITSMTYSTDEDDDDYPVGDLRKTVAVISFDSVQERFEITELPFITRSDWIHPTLFKWQDNLSLVNVCDRPVAREKICDIYTSQEGVWVNMFSFNIPYHIRRVVGVLVEEKQESCKIIAVTKDELVICDMAAACVPLKSGIERFQGQIEEKPFMACDFVESLLSLEGTYRECFLGYGRNGRREQRALVQQRDDPLYIRNQAGLV